MAGNVQNSRAKQRRRSQRGLGPGERSRLRTKRSRPPRPGLHLSPARQDRHRSAAWLLLGPGGW